MALLVRAFVFVEIEMAGDMEEMNAEEQAAFNAGVGEPTVTPEPTAEVEKVEQKPEEEIAPKWAQITEDQLSDLMKKAGSIDEMRTSLEKSFGTAFGKIGGIERVLTQLQSAPTGIAVTADDFPELREQFPELAELQAKDLNKIFAKIKGGNAIDMEAVNAMVSEKVAETRQQLLEESRQQMIDSTLDEIVGRPWREDRDSPEYAAWLATQPDEVKALTRSDFLRDASKVLRQYQAFKSSPKTPDPKLSTRKQQLEAGVTPKGTGAGNLSNPNSDEAAQKAFDDQFKD